MIMIILLLKKPSESDWFPTFPLLAAVEPSELTVIPPDSTGVVVAPEVISGEVVRGAEVTAEEVTAEVVLAEVVTGGAAPVVALPVVRAPVVDLPVVRAAVVARPVVARPVVWGGGTEVVEEGGAPNGIHVADCMLFM
jgi:hypothetical protein